MKSAARTCKCGKEQRALLLQISVRVSEYCCAGVQLGGVEPAATELGMVSHGQHTAFSTVLSCTQSELSSAYMHPC